jgi:hypothetical protein
MKPKALFALGLALTGTVSAQIPERAQWEITFAQVEASAGLSDMRSAPPVTVEARVMERPWSAMVPLPFLQVVRLGGKMHAQLFVFWASRNIPPSRRPAGNDIACRDGICVKPIDLKEQLDWAAVVETLAQQNACSLTNTDRVIGCGDCEQVWIKTVRDGRYREQSCQEPSAGTSADTLLQLMKKSAHAAGY